MTETLDPVQAHQRELIEQNAALQEMLLTPGWQVFCEYADKWRRAHESVILSGSLSDPMQYRFETGRLQGINQLLDIPATVARAKETALEPQQAWVDDFAVEPDLPYNYPQRDLDEGDA